MSLFRKNLIGVSFVIAFTMGATQTATAYYTGARWPTTSQVGYSIDPQLDANLNVTGSVSKINSAASKWNKASNFVLYSTTYQNGVPISTKNFSIEHPCIPGRPPGNFGYATVCVNASAGSITSAKMYFNTDSNYVSWNTSGSVDCTTFPRRQDISAVALHEFGHIYFLDDYPSGVSNSAVMDYDECIKKLTLTEDDLQGATQMYGPKTGWENGYAQGDVSNINLRRDTIAYGGSGLPELRPRTAEFSVPVKTGSKYELIAGNAQQLYSYVYFKLFTKDKDSSSTQNYFKVTRGMYLEWDQYNFQKTTMSLDLITINGINMREAGCFDQYGNWVHPAFRDDNPNSNITGQWFHVKVDIGSCLSEYVISDWMIAYDSGGDDQPNRTTGQFRAYFDNVKITGVP